MTGGLLAVCFYFMNIWFTAIMRKTEKSIIPAGFVG